MTIYNTFPREVSGYNIPCILQAAQEIYSGVPMTMTISNAPGEVLGITFHRYVGLVSLFQNSTISITIDGIVILDTDMWKFMMSYAQYSIHDLFFTDDEQGTKYGSTSFFLKMPYELSWAMVITNTQAAHMGLSVAIQYRYGG